MAGNHPTAGGGRPAERKAAASDTSGPVSGSDLSIDYSSSARCSTGRANTFLHRAQGFAFRLGDVRRQSRGRTAFASAVRNGNCLARQQVFEVFLGQRYRIGDRRNPPFLVHDHCPRNAGDSICFEHRLVGVQTDPGVNRLLPQERYDNFFVLIGDGDELHRPISKFVRQFVQMRQRGNAGTAIGCPDFQHHHLALERRPVRRRAAGPLQN